MPKCPQDLEEIHVDSIEFMLVIIFIHVNRIKFRVSCVCGTFVPQIWFNRDLTGAVSEKIAGNSRDSMIRDRKSASKPIAHHRTTEHFVHHDKKVVVDRLQLQTQ